MISLLLGFSAIVSACDYPLLEDISPIEINKELEGKIGEKETEKSFYDWDDTLSLPSQNIVYKLSNRFEKIRLSNLASSNQTSQKLYLLFHKLKLPISKTKLLL